MSSSIIKATITFPAVTTAPSSAIRASKYVSRDYVVALRSYSPGYASRVLNLLGYMTK